MKKFLSNQNAFLWTSIFLGLGMAFYFAVGPEPSLVKLIIAFITGITGIVLFRKIPIVTLIMSFVFGFGYAGIYAHIKNTPQIPNDIHGIEITGTVLDTENTGEKTKIHIKTNNYGIIHVSTAEDIKLNPGDIISGEGGLFKPKPADIPYGFDFARHAYFNNLTANGYIKDIKIFPVCIAPYIKIILNYKNYI